jgi:hypothetical protein
VNGAIWNCDGGTFARKYWSYPSETCTDKMTGWDAYGRDDVLPASVAWHGYNLLPDVNPDDTHHRRYAVWEGKLLNVTGTITVSGLSAGKYVAMIDHWYGNRDIIYWSSEGNPPAFHCEIQNLKRTKLVKRTEDGVLYAHTTGNQAFYYPSPSLGYAMGNFIGVHIVQEVLFTLEEGQTSKVITYGDESSFALSDFCEHAYWKLNPDGGHGVDTRYSEVIGLRPKLYTAL